MNLKLGINTGFALNRFPLPEEWMKIVGEDLGLRYVQLTADMLNPALGDVIVSDYIARINRLKIKYNVTIDSIMTGAFTRVNHFSHPDAGQRLYWIDWFKRLVDIGVAVGATNLSSHFGIMSYYDLKDQLRRKQVLEQTIAAWKEIAIYAKLKGMQYLSWEPMSIAREYGETIQETRKIQRMLNDSALPIKLCLDVDHGDVSSPNPDDTNPYAWLREFGKDAPLIHLKQSLKDKSGHWPFTPETNREGKIIAEKVIKTLEESGCKDSLLLLEFSFREREPFESRALGDLKSSVEYWRDFVSN
ncbi:TIM barrel protein [Candidatus Woesearchaeota archaeon]|nr:TIM barrel protein [Candidatus Woesearchaeota archaeon]